MKPNNKIQKLALFQGGPLIPVLTGIFLVFCLSFLTIVLFGDHIYPQIGKFSEIENTFTLPFRLAYSAILSLVMYIAISTVISIKSGYVVIFLITHIFLVGIVKEIASSSITSSFRELIPESFEYGDALTSAVVTVCLFIIILIVAFLVSILQRQGRNS